MCNLSPNFVRFSHVLFLQAIQSSLSSSSLANNSTYATDTGQTINKKEVGMIVQLKRELEEKEKFTQR